MNYFRKLLVRAREYREEKIRQREESLLAAAALVISIISRFTEEDYITVKRFLEVWGHHNG